MFRSKQLSSKPLRLQEGVDFGTAALTRHKGRRGESDKPGGAQGNLKWWTARAVLAGAPWRNWFWCQRNRVQGACWIDRTGRAEGNSLGEGENQTELAACCTGPAQSFKIRNAEKTLVNSSITQHRTVSTYWKTSEVRTNFPDYTTSLLHLRHSSSLWAHSGVG